LLAVRAALAIVDYGIGAVVVAAAPVLWAPMLYPLVEPEAVVEHQPSPEPRLRMVVAAAARVENQTRIRQAMAQRMAVVVVLVAVVQVALQLRQSPVQQQLQATPALQD
jgi:hypothetical protein